MHPTLVNWPGGVLLKGRIIAFDIMDASLWPPGPKVKHLAGSGPLNLPCLGYRYTTDFFLTASKTATIIIEAPRS